MNKPMRLPERIRWEEHPPPSGKHRPCKNFKQKYHRAHSAHRVHSLAISLTVQPLEWARECLETQSDDGLILLLTFNHSGRHDHQQRCCRFHATQTLPTPHALETQPSTQPPSLDPPSQVEASPRSCPGKNLFESKAISTDRILPLHRQTST